MENYIDLAIDHYNTIWENTPKLYLWDKGPFEKLNFDFKILEYPPTPERNMWTYATTGMSSDDLQGEPIELHIFSHKQDESIIELLTALAYYHQNTARLNLNHTVNFGRAWQDKSLCTFGFISLPYLDGPELENMYLPEYDNNVKFYWLIPVTEMEVNYKSKYGAEALEEKFEETQFDYLNPGRNSLL